MLQSAPLPSWEPSGGAGPQAEERVSRQLMAPRNSNWSVPEPLGSLQIADISADAQLPPALFGYVPRPLLNRGPEPISPIWLDWPEGSEQGGRYRAVLALFIDENGIVQSTRVDEGDLPPQLLHRARRAFGSARFWPGELEGQAVKARLSVEVVFEHERVEVSLHKAP